MPLGRTLTRGGGIRSTAGLGLYSTVSWGLDNTNDRVLGSSYLSYFQDLIGSMKIFL